VEFLQLTKIYLIRHGSVENPDDISYGRLPVPLSETGRQQVKKLCQTLKSRGINFDAIYSSPVARALQSAEIVKEQLGVNQLNVREELTDVGIGELEGAPMQIIRDAKYREDNLKEMGFEIESKRDVLKRISELISEVVAAHPGESVALVSHGDVTRLGLWSCEFPEKSSPEELRDDYYLAVAEAVVLRFSGDRFLGYEYVRREGGLSVEQDHIRRTEAY